MGGVNAVRLPVFILAGLIGFSPVDARALSIELPFDVNLFPNIGQLISPRVTSGFVGTLGFAFDLRPYQSARPLTNSGFDFGVEVTAVQVPDILRDALLDLGASSALTVPVLPVPRLVLIKGFGDYINVGVSGVYLSNSTHTWGVFGQIGFGLPEEGPTAAFRMKYSRSQVEFVTARVWTPELLISKRLEFAEPYGGVGYQFINGEVDAVVTGTGGSSTRYFAKGSNRAFYTFMGLALRIPHLGFKTTIEGSYHQKGANTLGLKAGFEI